MVEKVTETIIAQPKRIQTIGVFEACLIHIYPTGTEIGRRYVLGPELIVFGRSDGVEVRIPDNSVSRRHAVVEPGTNGFFISDLGSTNGTFVNDERLEAKRLLQDGDYLRIGNSIFRFLTGGNIESHYHEEIYRLTIMDGLTQIHNKRYLTEFLEREVARSARHSRPLSFVMIDIDRFKSVNDTYGHLVGDYVIRELADRIRPRVRREDLFARYGGEEFCMVLVETPLEGAKQVAERVRVAVAEKPFAQANLSLPVTISIGISCLDGSGMSCEQLMQDADEKLYQAKRKGRNQVVA
jgi:two-component system, cell cycle response regulator